MMLPDKPWKFCDIGSKDNVPVYINADFSLDGYTILLTDLCHVWGESLDRSRLVQRATDDACNVDPSEDDQCGILIEKLKSAADQQSDTSLQLQAHGNTGLTLRLNAALPSPLPPLEWRADLTLQPASEIRRLLVTPLLSQVSVVQTQIEDLLSELADKDRVISKITDRLEASGNDLTTVFPGVSNIKTSRKKSQRDQLSRHVRGLGDFDVAAWRNKWVDVPVPLPSGRGLDKLFQRLSETSHETTHAVPEEWWRGLTAQRGESIKRRNHNKATGPEDVQAEHINVSQSQNDHEFQRQDTPPTMRKTTRIPAKAKIVSADMSTRSRQHHAEQSSGHSTGEDAEDATVRNHRKSNNIGSNKPSNYAEDTDSSTTDDDLDSKSLRVRNSPPTSAGRKSSRHNEHVPHRTPNLSGDDSPALSSISGRSKAKLGTIGGSKKLSKVSETVDVESSSQSRPKIGTFGGKHASNSTPDSITPASSPQRASTPNRNKLGTMGGKDTLASPPAPREHAANIMKNGADPELRGRSHKAKEEQETPVQPRETSAERANRRRDELKREIEQQAKAPVKKKRKF